VLPTTEKKFLNGDDLETNTADSALVSNLRKEVQKRVSEFDPTDPQDNTEFKGEAMEFRDLSHREVNSCDKCYLYTGMFLSFVFGAALPATFIVFSELIDNLGGSASSEDAILENVEAAARAAELG